MAYSTGSGDYVALMSAVLAHAVGDGWSTTGGNWPISKGGCRGIGYTTDTTDYTDYTEGNSIPHTSRYLRLAVGTIQNTVPSDAVGNYVYVWNMERQFDAWHIFSDPASGSDHIHVVVEYATQFYPKCYTHFSFGTIDKEGMTHGDVAYVTSGQQRAFAAGSEYNGGGGDWHVGSAARCRRAFTGQVGYNWSEYSTNFSSIKFIPSAPSALPNDPTWTAVDEIGSQSRIMDTIAPHSSSYARTDGPFYKFSNSAHNMKLSSAAQYYSAQLYSGGITLMPLPFMVANGTGTATRVRMLGSFPNVRFCSIQNANGGDEFQYAGDTWKVFPMLRKSPGTDLFKKYVVGSYYAGYAYKKVV